MCACHGIYANVSYQVVEMSLPFCPVDSSDLLGHQTWRQVPIPAKPYWGPNGKSNSCLRKSGEKEWDIYIYMYM